jgi:stress response protein SCP2
MGVSLKKGQGVSLKKGGESLNEVIIGLGWDIAKPKGLFGSMFSKTEDYDLDAICFLLGADGKVHNLGTVSNGKPTLKNGDIVFYNSMNHISGAVTLTGDNRTGAGDGDDEQIIVRLNKLPAEYHRLVFVTCIYQGVEKKQSFGGVENAFIRAVDGITGKELARFDISNTSSFSSYHSITFAELVREDSGWKFQAIGTPHSTDRFVELLKQYLPYS